MCHPSILRGSSSLPPEDRLLKFLVDSSADAEESVQCANCDQESSKKVRSDRLTDGSVHM
ncbi:RING finger protein 207 [Liparis tanakae]|uniref:RING finger protein 207 n=1 Tax=Liparis tanakae TaxID=230148 RepID=A0A4Z2ER22_9TELE|nr:RING finger protein 207 [Liparis tanakae]